MAVANTIGLFSFFRAVSDDASDTLQPNANFAFNIEEGNGGNDTLIGVNGDDPSYNAPRSFLIGGPGDDIYTQIGRNDYITEEVSGGTDTIFTDRAFFSLERFVNVENLIFDGSGDFTGAGNIGDNRISGGTGNNFLSGNEGSDVLLGNNASDKLAGGDGNDLLNGFGGNDVLDGNDGRDTLIGGDGDDTLGGGQDNDVLDGGDGRDILRGGGGDDQLSGGIGDDSLEGEDGNDRISGGDGRDTMSGGNGDDLMLGDAGDDRLDGQAANDTLNGGNGNDTLRGGDGADTFRFDANFGRDIIEDFRANGFGDRVEFTSHPFASFDALLGATTDVNGNAVIQVSADDQITLQGVIKASLTADKFSL